MPLNRLLKLNLGKSENMFQEINTFRQLHVGGASVYTNLNISTLISTNSLDDDFDNLYIFPLNTPWEHKIFEKYFAEYLYTESDKYENHLVSLKFMQVNDELIPETNIINLSTLEREAVPLSILTRTNLRRWMWVKDDGLFIKSAGLDHIRFPFNIPEEIYEFEKIHLIYNTNKFVLLRSPYHGENSWVYKYDKSKNKWTKYIVSGDESYINVMNEYIVVQIGYDQGNYSTKFTGAFELINIRTGEKQILELEGLTKILIYEDDYLIVKDDHKLLYIPIEDEIIETEDAITLYEDQNIGSWQQKVINIEGAFLGPIKIPEDIKIIRAQELNNIGEDYYNQEHYQIDKAIYYLKESIKFNPEYALAYSNLGLAYYTIEDYDDTIEYSKKAIELADNEIIKASSYYNIAMAYEDMEEWEKAMENYRKALEYRDHDAYREGIERMEEKIF